MTPFRPALLSKPLTKKYTDVYSLPKNKLLLIQEFVFLLYLPSIFSCHSENIKMKFRIKDYSK
jgi:hypothetical protein